MSQVHTPYHFVPLSKWVYMPDWAHLVSHDVPFKDGYSGILEYTLTNATPLCVGGEQKQRENKPNLVEWAKDPLGKPVIPGTSLKGMIRSVLEIASFGKFSAIDDSHFSYRDVSSKSAYLDKVVSKHEVKAAWLKYDQTSQNWQLKTCDFAKIKHSDIKNALQANIKNPDDAIKKYQQWPLDKQVTINTFIKDGKQGKITWAKDINQGSEQANLIFCNNRIKGMGQSKPDDYEFSYCFYNKGSTAKIEENELNDKANKLFASHNEEHIQYLLNNQSSEHGIPVFALFEKKSNKLHSLGLAKMPRVLYNNAAADLAENHQEKANTSQHYFDLPELMFGTLRDKGLSLKSRVIFSDAIITENKGIYTSGDVILNGPKATFKGAYLEQSTQGDYDDYNNDKAKVSGWKRYITQSEFKENPNMASNATYNANVNSQLELLKIKSQFSGKIVFNNLKPEELGALIWALQLGDAQQTKNQYHGLGHGKSLGAGAVQLNIAKLTLSANTTTEQASPDAAVLLNTFTTLMNQQHSSDDSGWQQSAQIQNLIAMTNMQANKNRDLTYMPLSDFKGVKNNKASLPPMELNGEKLKRTESKNATSSLSFAKGRLADLCTDEEKDGSSTWFNAQKTKQTKLKQNIAYEQEQADKAEQEAKQVAAMENMPEDVQKIAKLKLGLEKCANQNEKREFNAPLEQSLDDFIQNNPSQNKSSQNKDLIQAAQMLYDIVKNKNLCEYLNISNKKKLKPRKEKLQQLVDQYKLKEKS
ncbi:MAG: TIGR03986 family CRISPR-associated RAMP protein [Pseudoalteromonas sp.]|nr:TIGR03986 family CRISPR-associated RAMP protein [Pseudoalteromonas sp.]